MSPQFISIKKYGQKPTCESFSLFHCVVNENIVNVKFILLMFILTWNFRLRMTDLILEIILFKFDTK